MTALTKDRNTPVRDGAQVPHPVAASTTIHGGSLVVLDASGNAEPGSTATGKVAAGRAESSVDNSGGSAGDEKVIVRRGIFRWANDGSNPVDRTHIGSNCYVVDDQTVGSSSSGTSVAGKVIDVDADGVWVEIG